MALSYSNGSAILQRVLLKKANRAVQARDTRSLLSILREPYLVQFTVFLVAYGIAGKLGQATTNIRSSNLGPVWPAYGIALAAFLVCGYRIWPAIALGSFLIAFFSPVTHLAALGQSAGATFAAFSGAFLLQRVAKFDKSLSRLRDALALVVLGALGSALVSASIGTSVLYASKVHAYSGLGSAWLIYWLGDATGVLLITPLVLTLPNFLRSQHRARITELAVLFVVLTAACFLIFGDPGLIPVRLHVLAFAVLPFVMWAAIRFGVMGAGLSVLLIATIATVETALGSGPFAISTPFTNAVLLGAFFAVLSVTGITLASVIAEREQAQREREQGVREQGALEARLEAEQAVRASEDRLRLAQQAAGIGTFERNVQTGVLTWTPEMESMYGLPPGGFGQAQTAFENLIHPDDRATVMGLVDRALKTGQQTAGEWRVVWPDGSIHWIAGRWKVFMNKSGEPVRVVGTHMDVTGRKRTEEALRKSEERFRLAAQAGKMYAYEWDVATDIVMRSEEHVNVLGSSDQAKQLTRQQLVARVHPDERTLFVSSVDQLTPENSTTRISYRVLRPDGSVAWLEKSGRAFFDEQGKLLRMIGMVADITERKLAEEALRESEDKLRLLLDSTAEAIYGIDLEGRCTFCNPACLRTLGYERVDDLLGKSMHDLIHHTRADGTSLPVEECRIFQAFRAGKGVHVDDEVLWRANGTSFAAEYWSYPQRKGQKIVGAVVAFIDITQRKLAEAALANVNRRLIEAQEEERTRIARELHDDFAQRLALLAVELEQLHKDPPDLPEVRRLVGELQKQTTEIATDIQTLSHELHSAKLQYLGIATAMRSFCQELGEQTKVKIDFKSHDLPSPLSPDVSLCLFRVLQEALHNSAKHSGVRHVKVQLWGTSDEVHLTVSDAGIGFDSEAAERSQGLGLTSMEERLKLVKGTLSIESQPKRGTTIHARVPLSSGSDSMRAAG